MDLNFDQKCRACLADHQTMFSLFEVYEHELTLAMILRSCMSTVQISEDDGLPSHICDNCISVLTQYYNFTIVFEESEKRLKSLVQKAQIENDWELAEEKTEANILAPYDQNASHRLSPTSGLFVVEVGEDASEDTEFLEVKDFINQSEPGEHDEEMKKEIKPEDLGSLEPVPDEYLEIHIPDTDDVPLKDEEGCPYEVVTKYECNVCGEAHLYSTGFQQHMRMKHNLTDIDCEEYASQIRVKTQPKLESLEKSSSAYLEKLGLINWEPECVCQICFKRFHTPNQLEQHSRLHDPNKKYVCDVCGSRFIRKTYLDDHMEGHSTEKKHVCKFCGKAFRRRTVLRAHKRVHTHPNHYICELCGNAFTNTSTLKTHKLLIHVRERNYKCLICNLSFPLKSTLNKHVLRHQKRENGEKGFNCPECEMQYRDKSSLKRHFESKHQGKSQIIPCPDCPKKYTSKTNLLKHRRRHHATRGYPQMLTDD